MNVMCEAIETILGHVKDVLLNAKGRPFEGYFSVLKWKCICLPMCGNM